MRNSKEYTNVSKDSPWEDVSITQSFFRFTAIPIKIPRMLFAENGNILKFIKEFQGTTKTSK